MALLTEKQKAYAEHMFCFFDFLYGHQQAISNMPQQHSYGLNTRRFRHNTRPKSVLFVE